MTSKSKEQYKSMHDRNAHVFYLGALPGRPDTRKMLKMSNMHLRMSGLYKVVTKAKFCEFKKEIIVDVYGRFSVRNRLRVSIQICRFMLF